LVNVSAYETDRAFFDFFILSMIALYIMQLIFLAIGVFLGCAMKQHKRAGTLAVTILLLTYFLSVISSMNENLEFLKYVSPFRYFNPALLLREASFDPVFLILSAGIIISSLVGAYTTYSRRDLYI